MKARTVVGKGEKTLLLVTPYLSEGRLREGDGERKTAKITSFFSGFRRKYMRAIYSFRQKEGHDLRAPSRSKTVRLYGVVPCVSAPRTQTPAS